MIYQEVLENARMRMAPRCKVCSECNGIACKGVMPGAKVAGILAFGGGGPKAENFYEPLEAIKENGGWGIPTLKPWSVEVVKEWLKEVEVVNPIAFAMDIDSAGLPPAGLADHM